MAKQHHEYLNKKQKRNRTDSEEVDQESEKTEEKDSDTSDEASVEETRRYEHGGNKNFSRRV